MDSNSSTFQSTTSSCQNTDMAYEATINMVNSPDGTHLLEQRVVERVFGSGIRLHPSQRELRARQPKAPQLKLFGTEPSLFLRKQVTARAEKAIRRRTRVFICQWSFEPVLDTRESILLHSCLQELRGRRCRRGRRRSGSERNPRRACVRACV